MWIRNWRGEPVNLNTFRSLTVQGSHVVAEFPTLEGNAMPLIPCASRVEGRAIIDRIMSAMAAGCTVFQLEEKKSDG